MTKVQPSGRAVRPPTAGAAAKSAKTPKAKLTSGPAEVKQASPSSRGAWTLSDRPLDRRATRTVDQILAATIDLMLGDGSRKLSISAVCEAAGVSRGTMYRYFSSKEDLLDGVTLHLRDQTDRAVQAIGADSSDPGARLRRIIDYTLHNPEIAHGTHYLEVEPSFVINYLQRNFGHFRRRLDDVMTPIFETWDEDLGGAVDRGLVVDILVRYALSEMLVPSGPEDEEYPARIRAMVDLLRQGAKPR
ncbi:MAG TPA: TetR/AcrR family transcriptional regulator [Caulobacteraceae bacterium]|jgi:AcrR family transcriptional regulator